MQPRSPPIGIIARYTGGYYFGTMLTSMHHVARAAGVPLLIIQGPLEELDLPIFGAEQVAGWVVIHPMEVDADNLARLVASGAPVVTIATALENVPCSSVMVDNRGNTAALVSHLIDHGHQRIAYLDQGHDLWGRERYLGYLDALYHRGIALDPGLVLDTSNLSVDASLTGPQLLMRRGELAAQELIARGMPCSALVAGTDHSAIAAMQMLQVAGYRIPEDLAVVGFDDIAEAQYAQPPLTTVRTRFDEFGRAAVEYMLAVLRAERDARPVQIALPTKQLRRRSCGCAGPEEIRVRGAQAVGMSSGWQTALARQLIQVIAYPLELDPATEPAQIWPGVGTLIAAFEAALQGQDSSSFADQIERVWQQAVEITENQELLNAAVLLLEDAAPPRLAGAPAAARPAMLALFQHLRMAMMRARLAYEARKNEYLASSAIMNQDISLTLLSSWPGESQTLAWLRKTPANWGCLGLWADTQADDPRMLVVVGVYPHERAGSIAAGGLHRPALFPPLDRLPERALRGQDLTIVCPLRSGSEDMGVLALCGFADHNFVFDTESLWVQAALLGATLKRDTMVTRLEAQAHVLAQARDAAEDANRAKSAFLASMSHELRTPLNGILGYAQILAQADRLSPQQVRGIQIIQQSGEHLLTLITDILDLAKIEAGKLDLVPASIRFDAFLDGIVGIIRTRAEAKRLSFRFEQLGTLPIIIRADETRLRQILLNLLGNAVKFTERGGVTLRVSSELRVSSAELPNWAEATEITQLKAQNSTKIRFEV
ncbi:MAG TPA: substrate-binding domain-containing protein, partial [Roseiflexaceae bacterium]|nr:substrate-binding domain-containing protein [Roseiflexaceae bacterium]